MNNLLCSAEQIESKLFFSDVKFSSQPDFSIKIEFKNWDSGKYFFSRIWLFEMFCFRNLPERKIFNSKRDILEIFHFKFSLCRKTFASESESFSSENFISNSDFQWKSLLQSQKKLSFSAEQLDSKRFFFICEFFVEVWFLNKNWTQKLSFWKIFFLQFKMFPKVLYSKSAGTKISIFKIWQDENFSYQSLRLKEKNSFRIWFFFFQKTSFQTLILL